MEDLLDLFNSQFDEPKKETTEPDYGSMSYIAAKLAYINIHGLVDNDYFRDNIYQPAKVKAILAKEEPKTEEMSDIDLYIESKSFELQIEQASERMQEFIDRGILVEIETVGLMFRAVDNHNRFFHYEKEIAHLFHKFNGKLYYEMEQHDNYSSMPPGLKELQQANGVHDHGLKDFDDKTVIVSLGKEDMCLPQPEEQKGTLKWKEGDPEKGVEFVPDENGRWLVGEPPSNTHHYTAGNDPYDPSQSSEAVIIKHEQGKEPQIINLKPDCVNEQGVITIPSDEEVRKAIESVNVKSPEENEIVKPVINMGEIPEATGFEVEPVPSADGQENLFEAAEKFNKAVEFLYGSPEQIAKRIENIKNPTPPPFMGYEYKGDINNKPEAVKVPPTYIPEFDDQKVEIKDEGFVVLPKDFLSNQTIGIKNVDGIVTPLLSKALAQAEPSNEMISYANPTDYTEQGKATWVPNPETEEDVALANKPNKLRASQIEEHGIIFDSKLENYMYNLLTAEKINFRFQVEYVLQESFVYRHETIRPMAIVMDFVLDDFATIVDTKGWQLQDNKLKHKLLKKHLHNLGTEMRIEMPSSQTKCRKLVKMLREGFVVEDPLTEHAGTARKNKMKKHGWVNNGGTWTTKNNTIYDSAFLMNLPKYEFEELLIAGNNSIDKKILKVTYKEQPHLFDDITEFAIDSIRDHRRRSNFFRHDIIQFTKESAKWFTKVPNFEDYLGTWKTNTVIWDAENGFDETFSELERVNPVETKATIYK